MNKQHITLNINDIKPYENNPRFNETAVDAVKESIRQCGYIAPIIVDEDNVILAGHTRLKALIDLEYDKAEVIQITGLTKSQKKKYRLLDNKTNELAEWDFEKLESELEGIDFEGFDFGFNTDEIKFDIDQSEDESTQEEVMLMCPHCSYQDEKSQFKKVKS